MTSIEIQELSDDHVDEVIAVINAAFGFERSPSWYEWKHRNGPWGPSSGLVATDKRGIVGVRLLLPWKFNGPLGAVLAYRAVEAATAPRATGQGIFSRLNQQLMQVVEGRKEPTFLFSTPNEQSRTGYRKLGWDWLAPVPHVWRFVRPGSRSATVRGGFEPGIDVLPTDRGDRIVTDWSSDALNWRINPRSGHNYEVAVDGTGAGRAGLVYRRTGGRRLPALLPVYAWGAQADVGRLLRVASHRERIVLMVDTGMAGGAPVSRSPGRQRGGSLLAVWPTSHLPSEWPLAETSNWRLRFADLESVL